MSLLLGQRSTGLARQPAGPSSGLHAGFAHSLRFRASMQVAAWSSARNLHSARRTAPAAVARDVVKPPAPQEGTAPEEGAKELPPIPEVPGRPWETDLNDLDEKIVDGKIDMRPAYQRSLVWDKVKASKLVVTVLENRVVPTIYLQEVDPTDDMPTLQYQVLDGKQRLASLISFLRGDNSIGAKAGPGKNGATEWTGAPTVLKITEDSNCDPKWDGFTYMMLSEAQKIAFRGFKIKTVIIPKGTDSDTVLQIFQDLNNGSVHHTMQQSRRAMYGGDYVKLLDKLVDIEAFQLIRCSPNSPKVDNEMETDREMVLRFFAMWRSYKDYKGPMYSFLNKEIRDHRQLSTQDSNAMAAMFKATAETVWDILDADACRDTAKGSTKLIPALWDAVMVAVCKELHPPGMKKSAQRQWELRDSADKLHAGYYTLLQDSTFRDQMDSAKKAAVRERIRMFREMLQRVAPPGPPLRDPKRNFTQTEKEQKWEEQKRAGGGKVKCPRCRNEIRKIEHAEADHIIAHAQGGRTELDNMQLLHMRCNRRKGTKPEQQQQQQQETQEVQQQEEGPQQQQQQQQGPQQVQQEQQHGNGAVSSSANSTAIAARRATTRRRQFVS